MSSRHDHAAESDASDSLRRTAFRLSFSRFLDRAVQWAMIVVAVIACCCALYLGQYVLAPVIAGVLVGFTFGPLSSRLEQLGLLPSASAGAIVLCVVLAFGLLLYALAVPLETWSSRLPEIGEKMSAQWQQLRGPIEQLKKVEKQVEKATADPEAVAQVTVKQRGIISNVISSASDVLARLMLFIGTFYFFLATRTNLKRAMIRSSASLATRLNVARILRDTESYLSRYVGTIAAVNTIFGLVVGLVMFLLGVPQPHLWGALAAVLNFALFVGPIVMALILLGVGLATFADPILMVAPALIFVVLNFIEGQFVTPSVLGARLTLNPLAVFVTIAFWLWLWGPVGAFLAVPILILVAMTLYHLVPTLAPTNYVEFAKKPVRLRRRIAHPGYLRARTPHHVAT
jgi:predicted PurR-regulated permease PerM